jgi:hypothetical protein
VGYTSCRLASGLFSLNKGERTQARRPVVQEHQGLGGPFAVLWTGAGLYRERPLALTRYERSLRPRLASPIAPRRRGPILRRALGRLDPR